MEIKAAMKRYESKISSLEDLRDLSTISLLELINALYALKQRRASREEGQAKGAFEARNRDVASSSSQKEKKSWSNKKEKSNKEGRKKNIHHAHTTKIWGILRSSGGSSLKLNAKIASSLAM
ncbi:hypothetical protein J1N35_005683 [Gossypium stocksii]|uniref:Uncharacterized protein n=1 Tax=Gossypium stocksii TaxID=47602 RepID=A0A9D4AJ77_9ROSI|nr:hypothetical protein J1N35_005683 [Gossypium stocksii]